MSTHTDPDRPSRPTAVEVARLAEGALQGEERDRVAAAVADHDDESHVLAEVAAFLDAERARTRGPATVAPIRRAVRATRRPGVRVGLAIGLAAVALAVLLVPGPATVPDITASLVARADAVGAADLLGDGPPLALGTASSPTRRGLLLGEDLVRWQVARERALADGDAGTTLVSGLAGRLERRLDGAALSPVAVHWRDALAADPTVGGPDGRVLDALRAAHPEGTVEAGRWIAVLRLWPVSDAASLDRSLRRRAAAALDRIGLLGPDGPDELRTLLQSGEIDSRDLRRIRLGAAALSRGASS